MKLLIFNINKFDKTTYSFILIHIFLQNNVWKMETFQKIRHLPIWHILRNCCRLGGTTVFENIDLKKTLWTPFTGAIVGNSCV